MEQTSWKATMIRQTLRAISWALLGACMLRADYPYNYIGAPDVNYSLARLRRPPLPPEPLNKDGICVVWYKHWAPPEAVNPQDSLIDYFNNPYNNGRAWIDIIIKFHVDRVVTDDANLDADGFLIDPQAMIAQGVIGPTVKVEFEAIQYRHGNGVVKPWFGTNMVAGYKLVSVNGRKYWTEAATGSIGAWDYSLPNMQWKTVEYDVPVEMIKFPKRGALGSKPQPAENHLEVTTDESGYNFDAPGTRVAWSKATVKAMAPIILVHGTNANPDTWNVPETPAGRANFNQYFIRDNKYLCFNDIALTPNGDIYNNGQKLSTEISRRLASVSAKACHLIAHSKGGIDSRSFIYNHYWGHKNQNLEMPGHFEVLSLYTLDTPHRGTVLSDIVWNSRYNAGLAPLTMWPDIQTLMDWDLGIVHLNINPFNGDSSALAPSGSALAAQTTKNMNKWNGDNPFDMASANTGGRPIKFYNTAADTDWNVRNLSIDATERAYSGYPFDFLATSAYRILYWAKKVDVRTIQRTDGFGQPIDITELFVPDTQRGAEWNDMVVSIGSALYDGGTLFHGNAMPFNGISMSNHSAIKTYDMAESIMAQIQADWPLSVR